MTSVPQVKITNEVTHREVAVWPLSQGIPRQEEIVEDALQHKHMVTSVVWHIAHGTVTGVSVMISPL